MKEKQLKKFRENFDSYCQVVMMVLRWKCVSIGKICCQLFSSSLEGWKWHRNLESLENCDTAKIGATDLINENEHIFVYLQLLW